jgi:hypothetical protein
VDSPLAEPLRHNAWATLRLLEASRALTLEQLAATVPGTFGSVLATHHAGLMSLMSQMAMSYPVAAFSSRQVPGGSAGAGMQNS